MGKAPREAGRPGPLPSLSFPEDRTTGGTHAAHPPRRRRPRRGVIHARHRSRHRTQRIGRQGRLPREYVCVRDNTSFSGAPRWKSKGALSDLRTPNGDSIVNNGVTDAGADHIYWRYTWKSGQWATGCLHYPPDSDSHIMSGGGTVTYARWGGEC